LVYFNFTLNQFRTTKKDTMKRTINPANGEPAVKKPRTTAAKKKDAASDNAEETAGVERLWEPAEVLAADLDLPVTICRTVVGLLEEGNSIPFLARYRREATGGMLPDALRQVGDVKFCYYY
jgi:Tex-like protein N-terminal domain